MTLWRTEIGAIYFSNPSSIAHMIVDVCKEIKGHNRILNDVKLMIGTCAMESDFRLRRQLGGGPARGIFQVEPDTALCHFRNYLSRNPRRFHQLTKMWLNIEADVPYFEPLESDIEWHLENNDIFCAIMARFKYLRDPNPIPSSTLAQAKYWKKVYNTEFGEGVYQEYARKWSIKGNDLFAEMADFYDLE